MKKFLIAGVLVVFAGVAGTAMAASDHKAAKHAAMTAPVASKSATPKKHAAPKKHHGRVHPKHHTK